jgi:hypothetical protein
MFTDFFWAKAYEAGVLCSMYPTCYPGKEAGWPFPHHSSCSRTSSRALRELLKGGEKGNGGKCSMSVCLYVCREERENPSISISFFAFSVLHLRSLISETRDLFVVLNFRTGIDLHRSARPMFGFAEREILVRL